MPRATKPPSRPTFGGSWKAAFPRPPHEEATPRTAEGLFDEGAPDRVVAPSPGFRRERRRLAAPYLTTTTEPIRPLDPHPGSIAPGAMVLLSGAAGGVDRPAARSLVGLRQPAGGPDQPAAHGGGGAVDRHGRRDSLRHAGGRPLSHSIRAGAAGRAGGIRRLPPRVHNGSGLGRGGRRGGGGGDAGSGHHFRYLK